MYDYLIRLLISVLFDLFVCRSMLIKLILQYLSPRCSFLGARSGRFGRIIQSRSPSNYKIFRGYKAKSRDEEQGTEIVHPKNPNSPTKGLNPNGSFLGGICQVVSGSTTTRSIGNNKHRKGRYGHSLDT